MINLFFPKERISTPWIQVIQWSGLRGALVIALLLKLPANFPFHNELNILNMKKIK